MTFKSWLHPSSLCRWPLAVAGFLFHLKAECCYSFWLGRSYFGTSKCSLYMEKCWVFPDSRNNLIDHIKREHSTLTSDSAQGILLVLHFFIWGWGWGLTRTQENHIWVPGECPFHCTVTPVLSWTLKVSNYNHIKWVLLFGGHIMLLWGPCGPGLEPWSPSGRVYASTS